MELEISWHPDAENQAEGMLRCHVTDTGIGIDENDAKNLFQPFVQADSSMTRKFGGTGLGLALSRKLAHVLGGDLYVSHSVPGEGSIFVISVDTQLAGDKGSAAQAPRPRTGPVPSGAPLGQPANVVDAGRTSLLGRKILVVDDAPDNRVLVSRYLVRCGALVESAGDGALGAEKAMTGSFDIVRLGKILAAPAIFLAGLGSALAASPYTIVTIPVSLGDGFSLTVTCEPV